MRMLLFFFGFFIMANTLVFPGMISSPRMTDVLGGMAAVWLVFRIARSGISPIMLIFSLLYLTPIAAWAIYSLMTNDMTTFVASVRWLLALPIALAIIESVKKHRTHNPLIYGMWYGGVIHLLVIILQSFQYHDLVQSIGLAPIDPAVRWVYGNYRSSGMYSHPNESFAVLSMIIPISLYLYLMHKRNLPYLLMGLMILFIGGAFTYTRSPILVSIFVLIGAFVLFKKQILAFILKFSPLILALLTIFLVVGPPGGWERWTDENNYSNNSSERLYSTIKSFEVMVDHPFGLGIPGVKETVREYSSIGATHNAFTLLGGSFGIWSAFVLFVSFVFMLANMVLMRRLSFHGLMGMQVFLLFFFEEHLSNPFFILISMWILMSFIDQISAVRKVAGSAVSSNKSRLLPAAAFTREGGFSRENLIH